MDGSLIFDDGLDYFSFDNIFDRHYDEIWLNWIIDNGSNAIVCKL